ncbi:MAG: hypothetical protein L6R38_007880 [Xanthoria sp. 2 TBL-2021]|nr:MAG: hypothetical protein L6R38_007880 [Xanthoria sp. 2 TBL-2021]
MTAAGKIAPPLLAFAAGIYAGPYLVSPLSTYWRSNPLSANGPSSIKHGRMISTFEKNITEEELDAHCLNIELMRQKLRGVGKYQISSKVEGMNKHFISSFPASVNEEDLDVLLEVASRMRQRVQGAMEPDEVVDVRKG